MTLVILVLVRIHLVATTVSTVAIIVGNVIVGIIDTTMIVPAMRGLVQLFVFSYISVCIPTIVLNLFEVGIFSGFLTNCK